MASPSDTVDENHEPTAATQDPAGQVGSDSLTSATPEITEPAPPRKRAPRKRAAAATTPPATTEGTEPPPSTPRKRAARKRTTASPEQAPAQEGNAQQDTPAVGRGGEVDERVDSTSAQVPEPVDAPAAGEVAADVATEEQISSSAVASLAAPAFDPIEDPVVLAARASAKQRSGLPAQESSDAKDGDDAAEPSKPAVPTFGLLFKAPEPAVAPRRSRARPAAEPEPEPESPQHDRSEQTQHTDRAERTTANDARRSEAPPTHVAGPAKSRAGGPVTSDAPQDGADSTDPHDVGHSDDSSDSADRNDTQSTDDPGDTNGTDDSDDDSGRRRRRRGGRGRRRIDGSEERSDQDPENGDDEDSPQASAEDNSEHNDDDDADSGTGRKRTRRRRRSTNAVEGEDPPGTVTKVREARTSQPEEATGIKGSTRLEAKKQRRREGREAGRRRTIITEAEFLARRESVERVMVVREHGERTQIGVLEDGVLVEHYISGTGTGHGTHGASMTGNVYLGRVQNVLPSMEAAFVDIGKGRNAVLYAGEVNWDAAGLEKHKVRRIESALSSGQSVLVQVTKDPIGHKGARLTSQISLPGRYLVYVPQGSMTGISRKLPDTERTRLKKILKQIVPDDAGVIVRTAAEGTSEEELAADVARLRKAWENIQKKAKTGNAPVMLRGEADLTTRVVRDVFNEDFSKLVVSGDGAWETVQEYVDSVAPDLLPRLEKWTGEKDVFAVHRVTEQLSKAMDRKVWLPSGGSLIIEATEAMTVIDVNTGKFTGAGGNLEETVTKNNIEAAEEIVRQLRLRDIGGIIVVDFIDMVLEANRDLVVRRLLECLGRDRTKHQVAEVTSLGLVQMTRKRVGAGLIEVYSDPCEHCGGLGVIVSSDPIDRSDGPPSSADSGSSRGRPRRGRSGNDRPHERSDRDVAEASEPTGPTPAQIAAAAYAAAVQSHEPGGDTKADVAALDPATVEAVVAEQLQGLEKSVDEAVVEDPRPADDRDHTSQGAAASQPAAPRRRGGSRRAASAPAAAPAGAQTGVFTAQDAAANAGTAAPQTVTAAQASARRPDAPPSEQEVEEVAVKPRRATRRAASAPAGPPSTS